MEEDSSLTAIYEFGSFRLDPVGRTLTRDGQALTLKPRVFDLLVCLLDHAGGTVDRRALMHAAWGNRVVDDANIRQAIYELRKALEPPGSAPIVATVPLRGYRLTLPVHRAAPAADAALAATGHGAKANPAGRFRTLMAAGLVPAAAAALLMLLPPRHAAAPAPPAHSVAVLPFTVPGHDTSQDEFADGISTELINALSRVGGLRVSARTSSFLFRDKPVPATEVARQLNVGAVLEGSIVRRGMRVRIVAELVDAATGFAIWSRSYDAANGDLFDAQANIASAVASSLQVVLATGQADAALGGTHNSAAYDAYLRGMKRAREAIDDTGRDAARAAFEAAIALDPDFALARAWRARELAEFVEKSENATPVQLEPLLAEASAEADRALALVPDLGIAHLARAHIFQVRQNFAEAQREMSLARDDAPSDIQVLIDDVFLEVALRHPGSAVRVAELGASIDPLAPSAYTALGFAQQALHDYDGALNSLRHARLLGADPGDIALMEAVIALERGDDQAAVQDCNSQGAKGWVSDLCLAVAEHRLGQSAEAAFHFAALRATMGMNGAFQYAEVYAQWRQPAEAVKWLEVAYRTHDTGLATMRTNVLLDPIRQMPQYVAIERELRFPP